MFSNCKEIHRSAKKANLTSNEVRKLKHDYQRTRFALEWIKDRRAQAWIPRAYQIESLESNELRKVHCNGRDVGKTSEIEIIAIWAHIMRPNTDMLIATQCENHLFPLMNRIVRCFETTPQFAGGIVELKRTPSWYMRFENGFTLWGRIAGPRGINFQGLHVDWQIIDEAQEMSESAWAELYQSLNAGGRRYVYGVPNGLRNGFFRMTQDPKAQQFHWPSKLNPEFTREKDNELARLYGGRSAPGYIHRVLGQHGSPQFAVFDIDDYLACVDEGLDFTNIEVQDKESFQAPANIPHGDYYLGCDLGYAQDPSELVVYRAQEPHFINVLRVQLGNVNYARQQHIIEELDKAYAFQRIGLDAGNAGRAVAHNLFELGNDWCDRLEAIEFGSTLDFGHYEDGTPNRQPAKPFMTELIQRRMAERSIIFPRLPEREAQYAAHTYALSQHARIVYEKGDDHIIDADRCALLARHLDILLPDPAHLGAKFHIF